MSSNEGIEIRQIFEYEIKRKLSMRAKSTTSEMTLLINAFRFYDINNEGMVSKDQWVKTFGKIGINGFSEKDLYFLFDLYDINHLGKINYKDFTTSLYAQSTPEQIEQSNENQQNLNEVQNKIENNSNSNNIPIQPTQLQQNIAQNVEQQKQILLPCSTPTRSEIKKYFKLLLDIIRNAINTRNGITYYTFASRIKNYEDHVRNILSYGDFCKCLNDVHIAIERKAIRDFFSLLDYCDEGYISSYELLRLIRGGLSEKRKMIIIQAFALMDIERKGVADIMKIKCSYNAPEHPEVKSGIKTSIEIYDEFIYTFDIFVNLKEKTNQISFEDFIDYYHGISASIDNDDYFESLMVNVWKEKENIIQENKSQEQQIQNERKNTPIVQRPTRYQSTKQQRYNPLTGEEISVPLRKQNIQQQNNQNVIVNRRFQSANKIRYNPINNTYILPGKDNQTQYNQNIITSNKNEQMSMQEQQSQPQTQTQTQTQMANQGNEKAQNVLMKLKNILKSRGTKGIFGFMRMFKTIDKEHTRVLNTIEFDSLCKGYCINLTQEEIYTLFSLFDINGTGTINYDDLIKSIIGSMTEYRRNLVVKVFTYLDKDGINTIEANDIKGLYNASRHPEVVSGKKSTEEALGEWLDNFEAFNEYNGTSMEDRKVTLDEFLLFYNAISMSVNDDRYFEYMIINTWDLDKSNINNNNNTLIRSPYGTSNGNYSNSKNQRIRTGSQIIRSNYDIFKPY